MEALFKRALDKPDRTAGLTAICGRPTATVRDGIACRNDPDGPFRADYGETVAGHDVRYFVFVLQRQGRPFPPVDQ